MIKEIAFKSTDRNEYLYPSISIDTQIEQPFKFNIEILKQTAYFNEKLSGSKINIINKIPEADWIPVSEYSELICVNKKFKDIFEDKLKGYWYPTNNENYFVFLLDNCIDALDKEKTIIVNHKERVYWYESIENETFKPEVESNEYLFTLPQEPNRKLSTSKFEVLYRENNLTGVQFYKDINFNRKDKSNDLLRFKKYDDEGNCLE